MSDHRKRKSRKPRRLAASMALAAVAVVTGGSSISARPSSGGAPVLDASPAVAAGLSARNEVSDYLAIRESYTAGVASRSRRDTLVKFLADEQAKREAVASAKSQRLAAIQRAAAAMGSVAKPAKVTSKKAAKKSAATRATTKSVKKATAKRAAGKVAAVAKMSYSPRNALTIAAKLKGIRYRRGGTSPAMGFDCSGYTSYVFGRMGVKLPHTSDGQYALAKRITKGQAKPGDLVFWHGRGGVYHVAIYAGNGKVWHSPFPGRRVEKVAIWGGHVTYGKLPKSLL